MAVGRAPDPDQGGRHAAGPMARSRHGAAVKRVFDSFWRAAAYCLHPRVIVLSLLPLVLMVALAFGLGYFFWEPALDSVRAQLESWDLLKSAVRLARRHRAWRPEDRARAAGGDLRWPRRCWSCCRCCSVAVLMTPAMVDAGGRAPLPAPRAQARRLVARQRCSWSLGSTVLALFALVVSIPLWLIPPLVLMLPPLIWGWLTYRVMSYDVLAEHASKRRAPRARSAATAPACSAWASLTGYLGAAPSLLWASGALFIAAGAGAGAGGDLDLHAGVRVLGALVRALLRWPRCRRCAPSGAAAAHAPCPIEVRAEPHAGAARCPPS